LYDPGSGVRVRPGRLTALAGARPADTAAVLDRLGRYAPSDATWGGARLDEIPLRHVRERILLADPEADVFAGPRRELVGGRWGPEGRGEDAVPRALRAAAADDVVLGLPGGLDSAVTAQGRSLSGGQRQRVRLARALHADPEVLLAAEPTSALDAHTEAVVADRLRTARAGRTTVLATTSPLVLARADTVTYVHEGRAVATGSHLELLAREPGYRALVARGGEGAESGTGGTAEAGAHETAETAGAAGAAGAAAGGVPGPASPADVRVFVPDGGPGPHVPADVAGAADPDVPEGPLG
jgi:ABC-type transport system involved in cytochrome bd biosynthesis fused ATPase/permease subunit